MASADLLVFATLVYVSVFLAPTSGLLYETSFFILIASAVIVAAMIYRGESGSTQVKVPALKAGIAFFLILSLDIPATRMGYFSTLRGLQSVKASLPRRVASGVFETLDVNHDDILQETENPGIKAMDFDHDGKVTRDEFVNWSKDNKHCQVKKSETNEVYCSKYCDEVLEAAKIRQKALRRVRSLHPIGSYFSAGFDRQREKIQSEKITEIFESKTCERILGSVDHTNTIVNTFCVIWFFTASTALVILTRSRWTLDVKKKE
ncbi:hypothetical protein AAMO2058_001277200 [Amorphochlora amoebiformis]